MLVSQKNTLVDIVDRKIVVVFIWRLLFTHPVAISLSRRWDFIAAQIHLSMPI